MCLSVICHVFRSSLPTGMGCLALMESHCHQEGGRTQIFLCRTSASPPSITAAVDNSKGQPVTERLCDHKKDGARWMDTTCTISGRHLVTTGHTQLPVPGVWGQHGR
jgi:hypothetical protein